MDKEVFDGASRTVSDSRQMERNDNEEGKKEKKRQIDIKTEKKTERRWTSQFFAKIPPMDVCIYGWTVIQIDGWPGWVYGNTSQNTTKQI